MDYIKVKGREHLVRDPKTNSIVNTNRAAYEQYVRNRDIKMEEKQKLQTLEEDVANMKDDLNEIKSLLRKLTMNPDKITLKNLEKNFEYFKIASEIDNIEDKNDLRSIAKLYCKLYYKQQETLSFIGVPNGE